MTQENLDSLCSQVAGLGAALAPFCLHVRTRKNFFMIPSFTTCSGLPIPGLKHKVGAILPSFYYGNPKHFN